MQESSERQKNLACGRIRSVHEDEKAVSGLMSSGELGGEPVPFFTEFLLECGIMMRKVCLLSLRA